MPPAGRGGTWLLILCFVSASGCFRSGLIRVGSGCGGAVAIPGALEVTDESAGILVEERGGELVAGCERTCDGLMKSASVLSLLKVSSMNPATRGRALARWMSSAWVGSRKSWNSIVNWAARRRVSGDAGAGLSGDSEYLGRALCLGRGLGRVGAAREAKAPLRLCLHNPVYRRRV